MWALDFLGERLSTGRPDRVLNVIDEYTRRDLASIVDTTFDARRVQQELGQLFKVYGRPGIIRTDNGTEFVRRDAGRVAGRTARRPRPVEKARPSKTH
ncbi:MAG: integrase catalytic domain-containing protein [Mycobacteriales bacterium]